MGSNTVENQILHIHAVKPENSINVQSGYHVRVHMPNIPKYDVLA